jgi:hypothetical protein
MIKILIQNPKSHGDEYYEISTDKDGVWIGTQDGEGMQVSSQQFFDGIDKFYKENF